MSQPDQDADQAEAVTTTYDPIRQAPMYRTKVREQYAVTLPAELCRRLNITTGDTVEFEVVGEQAIVRRVATESPPPARGILRGYFNSWEEINRFIEEERHAWEDEEIEPTAMPTETHDATSTT